MSYAVRTKKVSTLSTGGSKATAALNGYKNALANTSVWNYNASGSGSSSSYKMPGYVGVLSGVLGFVSVGSAVVSIGAGIKALFGSKTKSKATEASDKEVTETNEKTNGVRDAIANYEANGDVSGLQAQVAQKTQCQSQANTIANMTVQPQADLDTANAGLKGANDDFNTTNDQVKTAKEDEKSAEGEYKNAQKVYDDAKKANPNDPNLSELETDITEAKQAWDNKKKARADKEAELKQKDKAVKDAKDKVSTAEKALKEAKTNQTKQAAANKEWAQQIEKAEQVLSKNGYSSSDKKEETTQSNKTDVSTGKGFGKLTSTYC